MKVCATAFSLLLLLSACLAGFAAAKPAVAVKVTLPTKAGALALADSYLKLVTPQLSMEEKSAVDTVKFKLDSLKTTPTMQVDAIDELVNHCTIALAKTEGIEAIIVTSAWLVKYAPANPRVINLFGVVLHTIGKNPDAIPMLEYAHAVNPKSELILLNAANTYLDLNQDAKAKAYIDKVIAQDAKNKSAWSALAAYWYKKGDMKQTLDALMKAAALGGGVVQKKSDPAQKVVEQTLVSGNDGIETIEQKLAKTNTLMPNTAADLIDEQFPAEAKQIRDRYLKLVDNEKMIMPPLPQMNVSGVKGWTEQGEPYMAEWQDAFRKNAEDGMFEVMHLQTGINKGDSEKEKERKGLIEANKQLEKSFADAQKMMKAMAGMPGVSAAQLAQMKAQMVKSQQEARADLKRRMAEAGISSLSEAPDTIEPAVITSDADAEKIGGDEVIPGYDYGSPFAGTNYRAYMFIRNDYEIYFMKYYKKVLADVGDILKVYAGKLAEEKKTHDTKMEEINTQEDLARKEVEKSGGVFLNDKFEMDRRKETLRYKKMVNAISDDYFAQWSSYSFSRYDRKMKPMLDQFWATCAVYIRNMNQPEVLKAEYARCKQDFWMYAGLAVGMMNPGQFTYFPETVEEERQLEYDIAKAKDDAAAKANEYKGQTKAADNAYVKWLEDNFALGLSGEFLTAKITPRQLTIEEYICGMNFKHVFDFKTGDWTTTRSFAAKIDVGIQVGPMKAGVSARADILESYDTYNIGNGKLVNCGSTFAKGSVTGAMGAGDLSVSETMKVTLDPAAQSELSVKFSNSAGLKNKLWGSSDPGRPNDKVTVSGSAP